MTEKKKINFTIMSEQKSHKTMDLSSISPVIIDVEKGEAYVDMGALHARSAVERGIRFGTDLSQVPDGKLYYIVWVSVGSNEKGKYVHGAGACKMVIDSVNRKGYKILAEHVNAMDAAMKGRFRLDGLTAKEKKIFMDFLMKEKKDIWDNSPEEFKQLLSDEKEE